MLNRTILIGRLTRDPELRYTASGKAVANFTLAVNRPFKNQNGDYEADFINCQTWGKTAENLANYQRKGNQIAIEGRIQTRNYENSQGQKVYVTEVVAEQVTFIESKNEQPKQQKQQVGEPVDIQDDLPF